MRHETRWAESDEFAHGIIRQSSTQCNELAAGFAGLSSPSPAIPKEGVRHTTGT